MQLKIIKQKKKKKKSSKLNKKKFFLIKNFLFVDKIEKKDKIKAIANK